MFLIACGMLGTGRGYQTKASWLLRSAMLHFAKGKGRTKPERPARRRKGTTRTKQTT